MERTDIGMSEMYTLPSFQLGERRIECPKCKWGYLKDSGEVLTHGLFIHERKSNYHLAEVSCDNCFSSYVVKVKDNKIYSY